MYDSNHYDALGRTTSVDGIGAVWRNADKKVSTAYGTNSWDEVRKYTATSENTTLSYSACYGSGTLSVETVTDEDGKTHAVYKDVTGKVVLERSAGNYDTYYVYDDMDRLRFVLPPCASDALASTGSWNMDSNEVLHDYAYYYEYDGRGRCIKKKLPGTEHILYEYDSRNRMTFSQDGVQRTSGKWTFYVYDGLNRLVQQGENTSKAVAASGVYLQNYYDDYTAFRTALPSDELGQYPDDTSSNAKGSLTGTAMNVFGSSEKIYIAYYYDIKGRVIKTIENNLLDGYNTTVTTYTFTDQPATVTLTHTASGKATQTEVYTYTYDYSDRISSVTHKLNSGSTVTLASYTYDNKGRMATKKLHGSSTNQLTYAYNIRNWITDITNGKFTQTLGYGSHYNGNISTMSWTANGESHSYSFTYDGANRILNATHGTGAYTEKVTEYDRNGNIKYLQRYNNGSLVDNLTYDYNGNQLTQVEDATGNATGFVNGASTTNEYTYDNNGNLTKDLNKGISNISYNSLNLPQVVTFSNGNTITYLYTADGKKLRTVHVVNGTATTTDYCGNVIYENGIQKLLLTEEGYVDLANSNTYYYYLKDHQGNNRVVINGNGTVQEVNHYYPFGGLFASSNAQPYKYNGKELDTKNGLNWYDYGTRHYDASLGRWHVVDPLSEKMYGWSPYGYCFNNPMKFVDKDGEAPWLVAAAIGAAIDYGFQVFDNYQQGKSGYDAWIGNVDFVNVGLSAINPMGKFKTTTTIAVESIKAAVDYRLSEGEISINTNIQEVATEALINTAVDKSVGNIIELSGDVALRGANKEMQKANQKVRKAQNQIERHPNSSNAQRQLDKAIGNVKQVRAKQTVTKMLNSTIGSINSDVLEQGVNIGYNWLESNYNWYNEEEKE